MTDETTDNDNELELDGDNDADSGSDNSAPPETSGTPASESKRVNDLMSNWQKAEARAKRAEAALAAAAAPQGGDAQTGAADSRISEFEEFARENARTTLYNSEPRFAKYEVEAGEIAGSTIAEMRASFAKVQKRIERMESLARSAVLQEHGLDPQVVSGAGEELPSFTTMSDKDFNEFLAKRDANPWGR